MTIAENLIKLHGLIPHPEGGYFREIYRSEASHQVAFGVNRNLSTSIYFLLEGNQISAFHRLKSDEIWYYHLGSALKIFFIDQEGKMSFHFLGADITKGEQQQVIIPSGTIFGAEVTNKKSFTFFSCMVSPGFDFEDFELLPQSELIKLYPQYTDVIMRLTF